jgi:hypothetical protein
MDQMQHEPTNVRKAFFGKDSCLALHVNVKAQKVFLDIGKKHGGAWAWDKAKLDDEEMGEILLVLEQQAEGASFFHTYGDKKTKIWVSRKDDHVYFRIDDRSKGLNPPQQRAMIELLRYAIEATSVDTEERRDRPGAGGEGGAGA